MAYLGQMPVSVGMVTSAMNRMKSHHDPMEEMKVLSFTLRERNERPRLLMMKRTL